VATKTKRPYFFIVWGSVEAPKTEGAVFLLHSFGQTKEEEKYQNAACCTLLQ